MKAACHGCNRQVPGASLGMKHMARMRQRNQGVDVQEVSHGKSAKAARTSSLETLTAGGDFVIRNPVAGSRMSFGRSRLRGSSVRMMESPSTRQSNLVPGRNWSRARACLGRTTCPLLDKVTVMAYCLTFLGVSQGVGPWRSVLI